MWNGRGQFLFLVLVYCFQEEYAIADIAALSLSKGGNIRIGECDFEQELYSSPFISEWGSCDDATTYTWRHDFEEDLGSISGSDKDRLTASAGFCPHRRCQLGNASTSGASEQCPPGLCYTKLENGRPSFGACCFTNGSFESRHLLGYYYRSQPTPKPIYKQNRIVLGGDPDDTSEKSFINANEISPGLIAAQCPMTGVPKGFANTVDDMKRLLIEQGVGMWVQLSPSSDQGELPTTDSDSDSVTDQPVKSF
jgi:hypothetical protein